MKVIGITGTLGAGKGTVVEYLIEQEFKHHSAREFIVEEIITRGLPVSRDTMTSVANELRKLHGSDHVVKSLHQRAKDRGDKDVIIESIRTKGEVEALKALPNSFLIAVDADPKVRYERVVMRKSATDNVTLEKFVQDEEREMTSDDPNKQNLKYVISQADFTLTNNGTKEELRASVERMLNNPRFL